MAMLIRQVVIDFASERSAMYIELNKVKKQGKSFKLWTNNNFYQMDSTKFAYNSQPTFY